MTLSLITRAIASKDLNAMLEQTALLVLLALRRLILKLLFLKQVRSCGHESIASIKILLQCEQGVLIANI